MFPYFRVLDRAHDEHLPRVCPVCAHPLGGHYPDCRANTATASACRKCGALEGDVHAAGCSSPWPTFSSRERGPAPKITK
jgi:hypothetical protein